ncbi:MAG: type I DNA topoisomerase [Spirochaetaceae bacterium]|nr:MAG: type I DNA topoisomerase [Spirochaetaceae bacterium]
MGTKSLVIVESPTKARTIRRFLPKDYIVEASIGHVRDLPQTAGDVPKKYKGESWARLGIDVDSDYKPLYITPKGKAKIVTELRKQLKECDALYLATDEDREGESISWHLVELLKPKVPVRRMVFHEITKKAITHALENPREIDQNLVRAQETRRILDRLYGFTLSPLIWKKIAYGLSAGRVQSPGLRMIVERERERLRFRKAEYWDLKATLHRPEDGTEASFEARLDTVGGSKVAGGKDFDPETGGLREGSSAVVLPEARADELRTAFLNEPWSVLSVQERETKSRPAPPFITSTLQQEGNRKLRMSARDTMRTAQKLYEEGLITYMRTDSPALSSEAVEGARKSICELYGNEYQHPEPRVYTSRSRDAQEAHEAIRPAGTDFVHPKDSGLSGKELALYELIWKRTLASQMTDAKKSQVSARIRVSDAEFAASGVRILFPGFLRVYVEGKDDPDAALDDREVFLPELTEGMPLALDDLDLDRHETKAPARYTEASLVQRLEREGIGRPSTYASIINTLFERGYVRRQGGALVPTFTGFAVIQLLERYFTPLVEYKFTSEMEESLDEIAVGNRDSLAYLKGFYEGGQGLREQVEVQDKKIEPERSRSVELSILGDDTVVKVGRYGPYLVHQPEDGSDEVHASIPEDYAPADLDAETIQELIEIQKEGPKPIGVDPQTQEPIFCLTGRYGPYVQLGEKTEENPKPKRASLPKELPAKEVTIDVALRLLSLPRTLGVHPETGKEILANNGRFGPYVMHDGDFRSLKKDDDVYTVELPRALELLAEEKKGRGGAKILKDFGKDEKTGKKLVVYDGKYGPYLKAGSKNLSLPDELKDAEKLSSMTLEQARELVEQSLSKKK